MSGISSKFNQGLITAAANPMAAINAQNMQVNGVVQAGYPNSVFNGQITGQIGGYNAWNGVSIPTSMVDFGSNQLAEMLLSGVMDAKVRSLDTVYPCEYNFKRPENIFHLLIWRLSDDDRNKNFWDIVYPKNLNNVLCGNTDILFTAPNHRLQFQKWMLNYTMKFFGNIDSSTCYVPEFESGKMDGYVIKDEKNVSNSISILETHKILPAWVWIVNNCSHPVYRMHRSWLFTSENDACNFKLFDVANLKLSEDETK